MIYADYDFYTKEYLGTMEQKSFDRLAIQASAYIDAVTFERAAAIPQDDIRFKKLKMCCCALADVLLSCENGGEVTSERNDGWEISHAVYAANAISPSQKLYSTALLWLGNSGLMTQSAVSFGRETV